MWPEPQHNLFLVFTLLLLSANFLRKRFPRSIIKMIADYEGNKKCLCYLLNTVSSRYSWETRQDRGQRRDERARVWWDNTRLCNNNFLIVLTQGITFNHLLHAVNRTQRKIINRLSMLYIIPLSHVYQQKVIVWEDTSKCFCSLNSNVSSMSLKPVFVRYGWIFSIFK